MSSYMVVDPTTSLELGGRRSRDPGVFGWALVVGLCALLIFGILAFGAVDEWATFAFEAGAAVLFLVWATKQVLSGQLQLWKNPLYPPTILFFGIIFLQLVLQRSAYIYVTKYEALQYVAYGIVLLIAAECVRDDNTRKLFAQVMSVFGAFYALFSLIQMLSSNGKIYWLHTPRFTALPSSEAMSTTTIMPASWRC